MGLVPGPYWLGSLVFAVFLSAPGAVLGSLLDTLDWDEAMRRTFGGTAGTPAAQIAFLEAFGTAFYFFVFLLVRFARRNVDASRADILPLLEGGEPAFRRIFGRFHRRDLLIASTAALAGFFVFLAFGSPAPDQGPISLAVNAVRLAILSLADATALLVYLTTLGGLHSIGRERLRLKSWEEDRMRGLRPLGSTAVTATSVYFGVLAVVVVPTLLSPTPVSPAYLAFLIVLVVLGLALFFLPLHSIHRRMAAEKSRELEDLRGARRESRGAIPGPAFGEATLTEVRDLLVRMRDNLARERAERDLLGLPTWPFEVEAMNRVMALTVTGVVAVVGRFLVDYFFFYPR